MRISKFIVEIVTLTSLAFIAGCGKNESETSRFNEVLGSTVAGAPINRATPDVAILADQAGYKPAAAPNAGGGSDESSGAENAAGAGGGDVEPIKLVAKNGIEAIFNMNLDGIFDVFVPDQIAAINKDDVRSEIQNTFNAFQNLEAELADKSGQGADKIAENRLARAEARSAMLLEEAKFDILSESTATVSIPPLTLLKLMGSAEATATPEGAEAAAAAGMPDLEQVAKFMPTLVINLTKSDESWKIDLKRALSESEANDLRSAAGEAKDAVAKMSEALGSIQAGATPSDVGKAMAPSGAAFGLALAKVGMILQGSGAAPVASEPTEAPKAEEKPAEGEEPAPAPVGTGRRGGRRP